MTVEPAALDRPQAPAGSEPFVPTGGFRGDPGEFDYVEEEWFATGEADGHPYATSVFVRRPRDPSRFSGTVVVEPLHAASAAPVFIYTSTYLMRAGHGWACVCSQKSALEAFVKPSDAERYASLEIWSDTPPLEASGVGAASLPSDPAARQARMDRDAEDERGSRPRSSRRSEPRIADGVGPFAGFDVRDVILAGHSQTGWRGDRVHRQRPRHLSARRRLAGVPRLLPVGCAVDAVGSLRRTDRAGAQRRRHRRAGGVRGARAATTAGPTATNLAIGTGSTSSPASRTWGRDTRRTTTTRCGRTIPSVRQATSRRTRR